MRFLYRLSRATVWIAGVLFALSIWLWIIDRTFWPAVILSSACILLIAACIVFYFISTYVEWDQLSKKLSL